MGRVLQNRGVGVETSWLQAFATRGIRGLRTVVAFYVDGFRGMTVGRTLWVVIIIKLVVMFGILRLFFFPDLLNSKFETDSQRGDYVIEELISKMR